VLRLLTATTVIPWYNIAAYVNAAGFALLLLLFCLPNSDEDTPDCANDYHDWGPGWLKPSADGKQTRICVKCGLAEYRDVEERT
jgi:hypothetical protein